VTIHPIKDGSVVSPRGFLVGSARCGIRTASHAPDLALLVCKDGAAAAGVFTRNTFAAAPVQWCRRILPAEGIRAVAANAGIANACTGEQGRRDVERTASLVAELAGCRPEAVAVASTGIIGQVLPMDRLTRGLRQAWASLSAGVEAAREAERAIMTTDTRPKAAAVRVEGDERAFCVGGMAKGSGMISPDMATMLAFLTTDAAAAPAFLQQALRKAAGATFNRVTVDGETSTNDTVLLLASGASGLRIGQEVAGEDFEHALRQVMESLAKQIARDGEGATKLIEVRVSGAADAAEAHAAARAIAESLLVKCAIHGGDPNWGRIVCAVGHSGAAVDVERAWLEIGGVRVFEGGSPTDVDASPQLAGEEALIHMELGTGAGEATVWTCDLSADYVAINAHYHT